MASKSNAVVAATAAVLLVLVAGTSPVLASDFVRVTGIQFSSDNCSDYKPVGWNGYSTLSYAAYKKSASGFSDGRAYLSNMFKQAQQLGFNTYRFFIQGDYSYLTTAPGVYDEQIFQGLDFVLDEASKYDIKVTPIILNLWNDDGVPLFESFCGSDSSNFKPDPSIDPRTESTLNKTERLQTPYTWYTSSDCRQFVKDFITTIVNRKNSINGLVYKNDPTIFSWNMLNEPRCKYCGPEAVTEWYTDIAAHIKSVDPNHMVTTGEEGFFDESSKYAGADPTDGNKWGPRSGQDFVANHASADIDYAVIHMWPDNWGVINQGIAFGQSWMQSHQSAAESLGKPLIVEEFGKSIDSSSEIDSLRNPWYELVYSSASDSVSSGGPLRGALFWLWDGTYANAGTGVQVTSSETTITNIVEPFASQVSSSCSSSGATTAAGNASAPAGNASPPAGNASPPAEVPSISLYQAQLPSTISAAAGRKLLGI